MPDPYTDPDSQAKTAIEAMKSRLEERGQNDRFLRMIKNYGDTLPTDKSLCVLDLGCGTGVVIRQLAEILNPDSQFHGADISAELLREAERLSGNHIIQWQHLDTGALPYEDKTFDVITMHTLLSHVPDPVMVLSEARRVLKKGGKLIVLDADHAGTTYNQPDYEKTRRIDYLLTTAIATNPDICRQLPRLLKASGYRLMNHSVDVISECGKGDYWLSSVQGFARLLPTLGALPEEEADAWVSHMLRSHDDGTFFASGAFYTFFAETEG